MAVNGTGVTALQASEGVLAYFWDLASLDQEVRAKAADGLLGELVASQQAFEAESEAETEAEGEEDAAGGKAAKGRAVARALRRCSPLMTYGVKRLVRGLGSSRQGARQGFALALTLVLGKEECISAQGAAALIGSMLEAGGAAKGGEQRDMLLGQIFGYGAVVRSGKAVDAETAREMVEALARAGAKKSFLQEAAAAVMLELLERVDDEVLADLVASAEGLKAWLTAAPANATPEALLLAVRLWGRLPAAAVAACPLLPAGCRQPPPRALFTSPSPAASKAAGPAAAAFFSASHLKELVPVLRATTHSHPRLHSAWPTLLALLIPGFHPDKEQRQSEVGQAPAPRTAELGALWGLVVERELFQSSHERKYLGFTLFGILLPHLRSADVPLVFTPNFLRCLSNNLSKHDSYLHGTAKKCLDRITAFMEKAEAGVRVAVTLALQRQGGGAFEKLTKAKKATGVLEGLSDDALQGQVAQLRQTFQEAAAAAAPAGPTGQAGEDSEGEEEGQGAAGAAGRAAARAAPQQQQWAVEQLSALCKQPAAGVELRRGVLQFLALHAFFSLDAAKAAKSKDKLLREAAQCSARLSPAARRLCAARLITLADLLSRPAGKQGGAQQRQQGAAAAEGEGGAGAQQAQQAQRHDYVSEVVAYVSKAAQAPGASLLAEEASEGAESALGVLRTLGGDLEARLKRGGEEATAARLRALQHLVNLLTLQALGDPEAADAGAAQDLDMCYRVAFEGAAPPAGEGDDDDAPHWMDTLMDILLTLLAQPAGALPSAPLREAVEHVFRVFCEDLTPTGMQDMLRIIGRPVEAGKGGDEDDVFESDEEEEEGGAGGSGSEVEGSESEEEEEGGSEEDSEKEEEGPAAAKAAGSGSESDDEGMSDEAMFRMDAKLAAYFAAAQQSRRGAKAAREELANFKMRVAALLEAFIKKVPGSPLLPSAVLPLLAALAACSTGGQQQAMAERLAGLVQNKLCKSRAEASGAAGAMDEEALAAALRRCLYLASRSADKRVLAAAAAAYQYLLRVAAGAAGGLGKSEKGMESLAAALDDLFTKKKTHLKQPFFAAMLRPPLSAGPLLLPLLLAHAVRARSDYMRGQAAALLAAALKARSPEVDAAAAAHAAQAGEFAVDAATRARGVQGKEAQRHADSLRAACTLLEALSRGAAGGAASALGPAAAKLQEAVAAAQQAAPPPKLAAVLQRMEELLKGGGGGGQAAGGGSGKGAQGAKGAQAGKAAAGGKGAGDKGGKVKAPKQQQQQTQQQAAPPKQGGSPGKRAKPAGGGKEQQGGGKRPRK